MPITAAAAALIGAGINTAGTAGNAIMQGIQNRKNRQFTEKMYDRQRSDALADRSFENDYNSPAAQMKRLKEAGLNPNLVYDNGGASASSATARGASSTSADTSAPKIDTSGIAESMFKYFDIIKTQADTNLVQANARAAEEQQRLTAANTIKSDEETQSIRQSREVQYGDYTQRQRLADTQFTAAELANDKTRADIQYTIDNNIRSEKMNAAQIEHTAQLVITLKKSREYTDSQIKETAQRIKNLVMEGRVKALELEMRNSGVQPNDPYYIRMVNEALKNSGGIKGTIDDIIKPITGRTASWYDEGMTPKQKAFFDSIKNRKK